MSHPKVSVIIPVYNVEAYLSQCLDSVCGQTLNDIEIIPVDDGSPDGCGKIIDDYAINDTRIKPIHQKNGGYGKAVNAGLSVASGEYIAIIESDDWVELDMLQVLYDAAKKTGSEIVKGSFTKVYDDKASHECSLAHISGGADGPVSPSESLALMIYESSIWSAIYKREFLSDNMISMIETSGAAFQDVIWKFMVYSLCDSVLIVNKPVYNYRVFATGSSSASTDKAHAMFRNYSVIKEFLTRHNKFDVFKQSYYLHQIFDCVFHVNRLSGEGREYFYKNAKKMIEEAEGCGVDISSIKFDEDVNDYVYKHVIPLYNSIKNQKLRRTELAIRGRKVLRKMINGVKSVQTMPHRATRSLRYRLITGDVLQSISSIVENQSKATSEILQSIQNTQNVILEKLQELHHESESSKQQLAERQAEFINKFWKSQCDAWEKNIQQLDMSGRYNDLYEHINDLLKSQSDTWAQNWKQFELVGRKDELYEHINNFWKSQTDAWERNWKQFELAGRNNDLYEHINNYWASQSAAWERNWSEFQRLQNGKDMAVTISTGAVNQYEYYLRANEVEVEAKIMSFKDGLDADSCIQVDKFFNLFKIIPNQFEEMTELSFPLFMNCFSDEDRLMLSNYDSIMGRINEIYAEYDTSEIPLSLNAHYYECGIKLLPNRISESFAGKVAIDCGAWLGDTALAFTRYGFNKIHCFEPMPVTFVTLERNIQMNNLSDYVSCHNYAIDEVVSTGQMKGVGGDAEGALLSPDGDITVHKITIDSFFEQHNTEDIALIKIDVEGAELGALKGAEIIIRHHKPVLLVSVYHTWIKPEQLFDVKEYLKSLDLGYKFKFKGMQPEKGLIYEYGLVCYV